MGYYTTERLASLKRLAEYSYYDRPIKFRISTVMARELEKELGGIPIDYLGVSIEVDPEQIEAAKVILIDREL